MNWGKEEGKRSTAENVSVDPGRATGHMCSGQAIIPKENGPKVEVKITTHFILIQMVTYPKLSK